MDRIIVIAEQEEKDIALKHWQGDVIVTGVGAANVWNALKDLPRDTPLLNVGYAGSADIPVGEYCAIGKVSLHHEAVDYEEPTWELQGDVPCYTGTDFVTSTKLDHCVFDMELAFILAMGFTDVKAVKVVSDNLSVDQYHDCINYK